MTISDIVTKVYFQTKTNSTSYAAADMLIAINNAYERVASLIINADGRWQWDDSNQTDLPSATTALVASQQDYQLATSHLRITRAELKDTSGTWRLLGPIDQTDESYLALSQIAGTTGVPLYYDKLGGSVFLYPTPNYSQAASLKLYYERSPSLFTSGEVSTGTKTPGFNSLYHDLIPLWVSYDYCVANGLQAASGYMQEIVRREAQLQLDYSKRDKDDPARLQMKPIIFK